MTMNNNFLNNLPNSISVSGYEEQVQDIKNTFEAFEMPVTVSGLDWKDVYATTKSDKKMDSGVVKFILLKKVGEAYIDMTVDDNTMRRSLKNVVIE